MSNRYATGHLALIASILLGAFVYVGYLFFGKADVAPEEPDEMSQLTDDTVIGGIASPPSASGNPSVVPQPPASGGMSLAPPPATGATGVTPSSFGSLAPPPASGGSNATAAASAQSGQGLNLPLPGGTGVVSPPPETGGEMLLPDDDEMIVGLAIDEGEMEEEETVASTPLRPNAGSGGDAGSLLPPPPAAGSMVQPQGRTEMQPASTTVSSGDNAGIRQTSPRPSARDNGNVSGFIGGGSSAASPLPGEAGVRPSGQIVTRPPTQPMEEYPETVSADSLRIYIIRPGDTLSRIAANELGSISLADNIFLLNRDVIADPDQLTVGVRIKLPIRGNLEATTPRRTPVGSNAAPGAVTAGRGTRTHVVSRGDTLSSIALSYYGSSSAWRFLHESNKNVISNPNRLTVGTILTVPPYAE